MFGLHLIAEALARIEHKLDAILKHQKVQFSAPMHFMGAVCPACSIPIEYQVDLRHNVVVRKCQCNTGRHVSAINLFPGNLNAQGETNGRRDNAADPEDGSER